MPLDDLRWLADAHAAEVWPDGAAAGPLLPVSDEDGNVSAYYVPYALDRAVFPEASAILKAVESVSSGRNLEAGTVQLSREALHTLEQKIGRFGSVLVSARRDSFPILAVHHSLHPWFLSGSAAQEIARRELGSDDVWLDKLYFLGPHELYFGLNSPERQVLLHAHTLEMVKPEDAFSRRSWLPLEAQFAERKDRAWTELLTRELPLIPEEEIGVTHTWKVIQHYKLIPIVDWTFWCVPTAATMVAGFWDNYVKGVGGIGGYGKVIDYWLNNSTGHNVPNFIDEIIDPTLSPPTWSQKGLVGTLNETNGYNFSWTATEGTAQNDWAWEAVKSEVDAGRPSVWGVDAKNNPQKLDGHAMVAYGYRISNTQKFVIVYNTWGTTANAQRAEYNYDQWGGAKVTRAADSKLLARGGTANAYSALFHPDGGEVIYGPTAVRWYTWGTKIKKTDLLESYDGGRTWNAFATGVVTNKHWNQVTWTPSQQTSQGRIRIRSMSGSGEYLSGDGSQENLYVKLQADLVPVNPEPNWGGFGYCKRDDEGRLIVKVKNQGTSHAAASTTKVRFQPSGTTTVSTPALAAGKSIELYLDIPSSCWTADCNFDITVDSQKNVSEAIETNNEASGWCIG